MKHPKSELKQDYYWECKDFYDKLPDQIEVIPSHTEILTKTMTHREILDTYKIKPYTLEQATGVILDIIPTLQNDYKSRIVYFKDNDVLYRFRAYRPSDDELSVDVFEVGLDNRWDAGNGVCFSNELLDTQSQSISTSETLSDQAMIDILKSKGYKISKEF